MTLALYSVFVVIEMVLHLIRERRYRGKGGGALANAGKKDLKLILLMDFLQIPLIIAMIGVGRTIAVFNHFTYAKMKDLAGVEA